MIHINWAQLKNRDGFALLITLLTVSVVISVALAIVELSQLQLKLSVDSRDAEIAFSAANAAKECGQYMRRVASSTIASGGTVTFNCFGSNVPASTNITGISTSGTGIVRRYQALIDWGSGVGARCSVVDVFAVYATGGTAMVIGSVINPLTNIISNYRSSTMSCPGGAECTIIAAAGYNSTCSNRNNFGVLKRELLLEF